MKKILTSAVMFAVALTLGTSAFADTMAGDTMMATGDEQVRNVQVGAENTTTGGLREIMTHTHAEASKGNSTGEHLTGVVAGGAIGVRKGIHRVGAGVIDLITFWIPKKQPLISPEKPELT